MRPRVRLLFRVLLPVLSLVIALGIAEAGYRWLRPPMERMDQELVALKQGALALRDALAAVSGEVSVAGEEGAKKAGELLLLASEAVARVQGLPGARRLDGKALTAVMEEAARSLADFRTTDPAQAVAARGSFVSALDRALAGFETAAASLAVTPDAGNLHVLHQQYFRDRNRERVDFIAGMRRGLLVPVTPSPRPRHTWAPNSTFYICYDGTRQPYFDELGCVRCDFNSRAIRDREELCAPKSMGERRILCLGDSFTFGWGVRIEDTWVRLVEGQLRATDDGVRMVNCGAAGTLYVDEYEMGLRERFASFEPDGVLVTLCLNDLLPLATPLAHGRPVQRWTPLGSWLLRDLVAVIQGPDDYPMRTELTWPEDADVVGDLLAMPESYYEALRATGREETREMMWSGGGPQQALRNMRDWCRQRELPFAVVLWPLFQGLGPDEHYPFTKMHGLVADFCRDQDIRYLDLLPMLKGQRTPDLWVSPADYHGNHLAHRLVTPALAEFVSNHLLR